MKTNHPCFSRAASRQHGRIHLPVAPKCNIQCGFCDRRYNCLNESRPGVTATVITPEEARDLTLVAREHLPQLSVAGIAGPGDPLANPRETLATLCLVRQALPDLLLCLSTNGLALSDHVGELSDLGLAHLTVTVNAVDPLIGGKIYLKVKGPNGVLSGEEGAAYLLERQLEGIALAKKLGILVKINMVIVAGVNDGHADKVASRVAALGADLMNCIPHAPVPGTALGLCPEPSPAMMAETRGRAEAWLPQMRHCGRCRADALGMIGEKGVIGDLRAAPPGNSIK